MSGTLRQVIIPATISSSPTGYSISGKTTLKWADYGVDDPSILVVHLDPKVTIKFELQLPAKKSNGDSASQIRRQIRLQDSPHEGEKLTRK